MRLLSTLAVAAALGLALPAAGQTDDAGTGGDKGHITAFACEALAKPARLRVVTLDDAADQLADRKRIVDALRRRNHVVDPGARLRLTFQSGTVHRVAPPRRPDLGSLRTDTMTGIEFRMNIWSTSRDSVLQGRQNSAPGGAEGDHRYRIVIDIHDTADGRCVWRGEAEYPLAGADGAAVADGLIAQMIDRLGETVDRAAAPIE